MNRSTVNSETIKTKPSLSVIALASFVASFIIARTFTTLNPTTVSIFGFHIHHFWYGIVLLAIGGWFGIAYDDPRISRMAAILYGAGGGIIGDEVGILLTLKGENYWTTMTYTFLVVFVVIAVILVTVNKYSKSIQKEFSEFTRSNIGLYSGVFLTIVSIAFTVETNNQMIIAVSIVLTILGITLITSYFVHRIRRKGHVESTMS